MPNLSQPNQGTRSPESSCTLYVYSQIVLSFSLLHNRAFEVNSVLVAPLPSVPFAVDIEPKVVLNGPAPIAEYLISRSWTLLVIFFSS